MVLGFLLVSGAVFGQGGARVSPQQQMEFYKAQLDSAEHERSVSKMAAVFGNIVALCRESQAFESDFPTYLYLYGMWSTDAGHHQTAIDALIELLDMPHDANDMALFSIRARAHNALGKTYFFLQRWDNALYYYQKALEMAVTLQSDEGISIIENNIGNIYQKKENFTQAIEYYLRSLQIQETIGDKETICNIYHNLATCHIELGNSVEGFHYYNLALEVAREAGDREIEALSLIGLAYYYAKELRQLSQALNLATQAEAIAKETGYKRVLAEIYKYRSLIDTERGDFASALEYFKQYKALNDEFFTEQSMRQLHEFEVRYDVQQKELEIVQQRAEIERQMIFRNVSIAGLAGAFLVIGLLVAVVRFRNKRNNALTERNNALAEMNATKDKFFSIISHDLKNPAVAQRDAMLMLLNNSRDWDFERLSRYYRSILQSANDLIELLYTLLGWAQVQSGRIEYNPVYFDLVNFLKSEVGVVKNIADNKGVELELEMPAVVEITGDCNMLGTVLRNLMTNAVKFTESGGRVALEVSDNKDFKGGKVTVSVSDTGVGMSKEQVDNLYRLDKSASRSGTDGEQGNGLGLIVCRELLEKHGSGLNVESVEGRGSRFWFELGV